MHRLRIGKIPSVDWKFGSKSGGNPNRRVGPQSGEIPVAELGFRVEEIPAAESGSQLLRNERNHISRAVTLIGT